MRLSFPFSGRKHVYGLQIVVYFGGRKLFEVQIRRKTQLSVVLKALTVPVQFSVQYEVQSTRKGNVVSIKIG